MRGEASASPPARGTLADPPWAGEGLEEARLRALRHDVRQRVENRPGVYWMVAAGGATVYVGKSVRVRARLLSYFRADAGDKARDILAATERILWEPVPDEFSALIREMRLIRRWRPAFNVEHNRTRGFSFVRLGRESAARITVTSRVRADGAHYYGPFGGRAGVKTALRELLDALQLRDCPVGIPMRFTDQGELFRIERAPECLRGELDRCLAPCAGRCSEAAYRERVRIARAFLEGRTDAPIRALEARMWTAADRLEYEHAALLRERVDRLTRMRDRLMMLWRETRALTGLYSPSSPAGEDRVYLLDRGSLAAELPMPRTAPETRALATRARRLLGARRPPLHALEPDRLMEVLLVTRWFRSRPEERARTTPLDRVDERWRPPPEGASREDSAGDASRGTARRLA